MSSFASVSGDEELPDLLSLISRSKELEDVQLRRAEKTSLNALNRDKNKPSVRYPIEGKVKDGPGKVSILAQAHLGCLNIADPGLQREANRIAQVGLRLSRCLAALLWSARETDPGDGGSGNRRSYKAVKASVELAKCFESGVWNNSVFVSKQFDRVGIAYSTALVNAGFTSFQKIATANPRELEMCLNKQPPFGNHLRNCAIHMPEYALSVEQVMLMNHPKSV